MVLFAAQVSDFFTTLREGIRGLVPLFVLLIYTIIGALIFMSIEGPNEQFQLEQLKKERDQLLENTTVKLNIIKRRESKIAKNYTEHILIEYRDALGVGEVNLNDTKWDIWGSIYYSMCIYTTIG
uniref:Potassium channel domain-containing protein n=1 Tax=Acrobeloides nanus TaxID=290746 RepID=A0A914CQC7_9BILA